MRRYPYSIDNGNGEQLTFSGVTHGPDGDRSEAEGVEQPGAGAPMHVHYVQVGTLFASAKQNGGRPALFDAAQECAGTDQVHAALSPMTIWEAHAGLILALVCLYRIPDCVLNIMNPFYLDLGYALVEIAEVRKIFGVGMTMLGVFAGGVAVARYGLLPAMVIGAFAGPVSNLLCIWLAMQDHSLVTLFAAIGLDNLAGGFAGTCLIA